MQLLTQTVQDYMESSVLCWLATSNKNNLPNVSPKEIFCYHYKNGQESILIANIASPGSLKNIKVNPQVCLSFIDVLIQKGYQIHGNVKLIHQNDEDFDSLSVELEKMTSGVYPFTSIFQIFPTRINTNSVLD